MSDAVKLGFQTYAYAAGTTFMAPDSKNPDSPFANIIVREAVDYAIDRQTIVDAVGYGYKVVNYQLPKPVQYYHNPDIVGRAYNLEKAKAGWWYSGR
jgi:peptide/nickel transport system substrate-binding protein